MGPKGQKRPANIAEFGRGRRSVMERWRESSDAARAVGLANGANPIAIVVPCHCVIGADARLAGYGGGVDRKRWLLAHEDVAFGDLSVGCVSNVA